jgi:DNA-binding winged helix-turn-helix (wHTH) protein
MLPVGQTAAARTSPARSPFIRLIWGTDFVAETNIVDRHIRSLRLTLQDDYRRPRFIATVLGRGYRFIPMFSNAGWAGADDPVPWRLVEESLSRYRSRQVSADDGRVMTPG